jgi:hypothetical protein
MIFSNEAMDGVGYRSFAVIAIIKGRYDETFLRFSMLPQLVKELVCEKLGIFVGSCAAMDME